jgi:NADH-quinone oxidoreductase subunit N
VVILCFLIVAATEEVFGFRLTVVERHQFVTNNLISFLISFSAAFRWVDTTEFLHQGYIISNFYTITFQWFLTVCTVFFLIITAEYLIKFAVVNEINLIELPLLICFSLFFMLLLVSSFNIFGAYIAIEGLTFSLYILAGMNYKSQNCLEAGMKYFCLGTLASGFFLFGIALVFITTKTLDFSELRFIFNSVEHIPLLVVFALIFIIFGVWFKLSIFPCHIWTPDVYEGVLMPVTLFFSTLVKLSVFAFLVRVLFFLLGAKVFICFWRPVFFVGAVSSILFGGLGALRQTKIKRFIGYTSINQMGYLLIGISSGDFFGLQASFLFLFFYIITGFIFFAILLHISNFTSGKEILFINQLRRFGQEHRHLASVLALVLFSMAGIPPLIGFFGKFFLFFSAFKAGNFILIIFASGMNIVSAFYYLRIVKCMFFERVESEQYFFYAGEGSFMPWLLDGTVGFFLLILVLAPVFLNMLLAFFWKLGFGASWI